MTADEPLKILRENPSEWNNWRNKHGYPDIDLQGADLSGCHLDELNLSGVNLSSANLYRAFFTRTSLRLANLINANLTYAKLYETDLQFADCTSADFSHAHISDVDLTNGIFSFANFGGAFIVNTKFISCKLNGANLYAMLSGAVFSNIDLSETLQLEFTVHTQPSHLTTSTFQESKGMIPLEFLRGCGVTDMDIEYANLHKRNLSLEEVNDIIYTIHALQIKQPIQISPLFISYSHADAVFVDEMEHLLYGKGIRFWRDIHDATSGRLENQIDQAMRLNPTVLLVLSENSIESDWVEHEVRLARNLEKELGRDVICPIALDPSWKDARWPARLKEQIMEYNILDFSKWNDSQQLSHKFDKLISGLKQFYQERKS